MKKLLALILAVLMIAGCVSAMAEDQFAALGNYTMTVGHAQPESNPRYISMEKFAADVAEKTNGHVTVEVFGNGQLGTEKEMLEQVVAGVTQGMRGGQYDFSPRLLMFTLPFLANNRAEVTALLQSDLAKKVSAEAAETTGTVIINLCDAGGFRQFSNNTRPLTKPEDLAGLKMRTNGMKTIDLTFQAMGANTVSVPYADLYMGLKTAIADGQENPWVNVEGMKFYEVQKYFTEVNYQFHPDPFYVNAEWWNSLPAEFQAILTECATEMGEYNDQLIDQNSDAAKQVVVDAGCEVYVPTAEELAAFQTACQPVYAQVVEEGICTQEELDEMLAIVAAVRGE
ncbi:MAG: TRAP transporter substrate-binding protein [Clostridia bacterium]|nr:TRAP transporter substrate-binding protein [Clostridia bacterium]MBQ6858063.1 TRAP transporter substrate-binding protein [Clostridia bacterium]MBQ7053220.1 TRAP transporter substrate-binding protein [Clostridia bacterium]